MGKFVEETGVGASFEAGSVSGVVTAIKRVLKEHASMRAAITPELLHEWSWERQADVLAQTYSRISGQRPTPRVVAWDVSEVNG